MTTSTHEKFHKPISRYNLTHVTPFEYIVSISGWTLPPRSKFIGRDADRGLQPILALYLFIANCTPILCYVFLHQLQINKSINQPFHVNLITHIEMQFIYTHSHFSSKYSHWSTTTSTFTSQWVLLIYAHTSRSLVLGGLHTFLKRCTYYDPL